MRKQIESICRGLINPIMAAKVSSVNMEDCTCDVKPLTGGADLLDVLLRADDGTTKGQIIYPKKGSIVMVAPIDNDNSNYCVVMFSEVDQIINEIEDTRLLVSKEGVTIAKGNDGLKEALLDLVDQILKIYAPMNKPEILKVRNRIKQLLNDA